MRWADVEHWLWPLFSAKSRSWRQVWRPATLSFSLTFWKEASCQIGVSIEWQQHTQSYMS